MIYLNIFHDIVIHNGWTIVAFVGIVIGFLFTLAYAMTNVSLFPGEWFKGNFSRSLKSRDFLRYVGVGFIIISLIVLGAGHSCKGRLAGACNGVKQPWIGKWLIKYNGDILPRKDCMIHFKISTDEDKYIKKSGNLIGYLKTDKRTTIGNLQYIKFIDSYSHVNGSLGMHNNPPYNLLGFDLELNAEGDGFKGIIWNNEGERQEIKVTGKFVE
ncbi:MAG TPA: hypothetical protein PLO67_17310 [Saprospiraceae bacterium]|nr:hypothetical protein [Saprospiraceae bacterium]HOY07172.1 hypothetical protein [Saprospiraceae bacterium]HPI07855.1 hypothetical protein [Saprospiraceae bacterium]